MGRQEASNISWTFLLHRLCQVSKIIWSKLYPSSKIAGIVTYINGFACNCLKQFKQLDLCYTIFIETTTNYCYNLFACTCINSAVWGNTTNTNVLLFISEGDTKVMFL